LNIKNEEPDDPVSPKPLSLVAHQAHDDEAWIISYADMMTLLFGFFVILFSMSTFDPDKLASLGNHLAEEFGGERTQETEKIEYSDRRVLNALHLLLGLQSPEDGPLQGLSSVSSGATSTDQDVIQAALNTVTAKPADSIVSQKVLVNLAMPTSLIFDSPGINISSKGEEHLIKVANWVARFKDKVRIEIVGHTDSTPVRLGAVFTNNWSFSAARAGAVAEVLIKYGIPGQLIVTRGMADKEPLVPEHNELGEQIKDNMRKNRRVHIILRHHK
jgi:chemotaxis protein MotB